MGRPRNVQRPVRLVLNLPEDIRARIDLFLWSDLENCVPMGAYTSFFRDRVRDFFDTKALDLAPYLNCPSGVHCVRGPAHSIAALKSYLERATEAAPQIQRSGPRGISTKPRTTDEDSSVATEVERGDSDSRGNEGSSSSDQGRPEGCSSNFRPGTPVEGEEGR